MPPVQEISGTLKKSYYLIIIALIAILILLSLSVVYIGRPSIVPVQPENPTIVQSVVAIPEDESLGGTLYEKANNPLEDKLPEQSPVANPIEDAYKNPF